MFDPRPFATLASVLILAGLAVGQERYDDPELTPDERSHWSFIRPERPTVPGDGHPVDAFVRAKLTENGLAPAPEADRRTLIRRLTFDLTGLPPTPVEVDDFVADESPDAYEMLVDRLLASPHYGERWAQHWLDVVRFAETNGYEADGERPHAWRYRDYVVRAFNADKPYDEFVREQVAGDLLAGDRDPLDVADLWAATGMHRCGPSHVVGGNVDKDELRQEYLTEMVNGLGSAVLGLTVACARCHDHKFDPISLGDYYRLQAFFAGAVFRDVPIATATDRETATAKTKAVNAKLAPINKKIAALETPYRTRLTAEKKATLDPDARKAVDTPAADRTDEQKKLAADSQPVLRVYWDEILDIMSPADRAVRDQLKTEQRRLKADLPPPLPHVWAIDNVHPDAVTHVLKRGSVKRKAGVADPAYLRVVALGDEPKSRLDLADWLTDPRHPLTARVIVNRLWQHHFGAGIVRTPNDYGTRGEAPTHPALLDWLAVELVDPTVRVPGTSDAPWSLKRLHKLMVTSATYKQASTVPGSEFRVPSSKDPENHLLWRANRRRLDAETVRDAILVAAGTLTDGVGGRSVKVPLEPEVYDLIFTEGEPDNLWPVTPDTREHTRRSLYLFRKRNVRLPILEAFDQPDTLNPCADRAVSTFAPQALILMNGPFARDQAKAMAVDLLRTVGANDETIEVKIIDALYRRAVGRLPRTEERAATVAFLAHQSTDLRKRLDAGESIGVPDGLPDGTDPAFARAVADLCLAVFNTNDFVYVD